MLGLFSQKRSHMILNKRISYCLYTHAAEVSILTSFVQGIVQVCIYRGAPKCRFPEIRIPRQTGHYL